MTQLNRTPNWDLNPANPFRVKDGAPYTCPPLSPSHVPSGWKTVVFLPQRLAVRRWPYLSVLWCTTESSKPEKDLSQRSPVGLPCSVAALINHPAGPQAHAHPIRESRNRGLAERRTLRRRLPCMAFPPRSSVSGSLEQKGLRAEISGASPSEPPRAWQTRCRKAL